jgi:hypothetical protein
MDDVVVKIFSAAILGGASQVISGQAILREEKSANVLLINDNGSRASFCPLSRSRIVAATTVITIGVPD